MSDFAIIADCTSGLHRELREKYGIDDYVKGKIIFPDGSDHDTDLDWEEISADDYYGSMAKNKAMYKTGVVAPEVIEEVMEKYLAAGRDVLTITLSSGMSNAYSTYMLAKKHLEEKYPERKVAVVDSLRFSTPILMMNIKASEMRAEGKSIDETAAWLEENKNCFHQMGPLDDLKFLARAGRITNVKAFFGTLVGVNSLGDFAPNGISQILTNVKGRSKALQATVEYVKQTIVNPEEQVIFVSHTYRQKDAEQLVEMVKAAIPCKEVVLTRVDMSCGANIGPGMLGVYYIGEKATEGLEKETAIMLKIAENLK